jgi:hypothetical protein
MGEKRSVYRIFMRKPEGMRPLGKPRRKWEDNNRMYEYIITTGCENGLDSSGSGYTDT